jgi:predicted porin
MRKLLLASVATLGFAGSAYAAALVEINQATSPPSVGNAGGVATPGFLSAFGAPKTNPDPGNVIVRFDGLIAWDTGFTSANGNKGNVYTAGAVTGTGKLDAFQNNGYFRLYGGVDGKLMNGVIWGGNFEMRTNFSGGAPGGYSLGTGSAVTVNGSADSTASLWYTRRAFGYVGAPAVGLFRYGQTDGPLSLFTGAGITTGEAFSTGAWDGDVPDLLPGNSYSGWTFNDIGNEYTDNKVVYISPSFAGVNVAVSFAPNSSDLQPTNGGSASGGSNTNQASSVLGSDLGRPRNIIEAAVRWQGAFGPVSIDSMIGGQHSATPNNGNSLSPGVKFKGLDTVDGGASVTIFGASIFGHVFGGTMNGTGTPVAVLPTRGAPKAWSYVEGAQYTIGPWTVGASYWTYINEGSGSGLGMQSFRGTALGGYYAATPSWNIALEYLHGQRHQAGVNFIDSGSGVPTNAGNNVTTNGIALTSTVLW